MRRQTYRDGWIPGYIYAMVRTKPSLVLHRPVTIDDRTDEKASMEAADAR